MRGISNILESRVCVCYTTGANDLAIWNSTIRRHNANTQVINVVGVVASDIAAFACNDRSNILENIHTQKYGALYVYGSHRQSHEIIFADDSQGTLVYVHATRILYLLTHVQICVHACLNYTYMCVCVCVPCRRRNIREYMCTLHVHQITYAYMVHTVLGTVCATR